VEYVIPFAPFCDVSRPIRDVDQRNPFFLSIAAAIFNNNDDKRMKQGVDAKLSHNNSHNKK
jgi:hypothetical protein